MMNSNLLQDGMPSKKADDGKFILDQLDSDLNSSGEAIKKPNKFKSYLTPKSI